MIPSRRRSILDVAYVTASRPTNALSAADCELLEAYEWVHWTAGSSSSPEPLAGKAVRTR
ncbi:hypothetical protein MINTM019_29480 [Mycobacterium paraintracellulare]|uniref:Uncharacterized protein n=1 Tax=Mycobacterium paraintracellulare TaxID=1138383 RepID=A0ABN6AUW4_9MYCO|nr:hypothetical protein MPRI_48000 [Mycobacterium paraintracellulare]BCO89710.1 hypothetical protein MINTM015_29670 [Mycobacterium paraintracellulare]BCP05492.1 hypothetical protein MINTM019_29480 [Mycobacterium paraintracellulare]